MCICILEENDVFIVFLIISEFNLEVNSLFGFWMLKVKLNLVKEVMWILFNLNLKVCREIIFFLNNCKIEIEKCENGI